MHTSLFSPRQWYVGNPPAELQVHRANDLLQILLTLRAEATVQVNPDPVYIVNGLTFPGLSVKGLISIGPQLNLIGEMDASMRVSGELNAGVALTWPRAEVYFPQNDDGEDATVGPKDLQDGDNQVFSVDPTFDASLSAEGNMDCNRPPPPSALHAVFVPLCSLRRYGANHAL
jgi:hypothetical protein